MLKEQLPPTTEDIRPQGGDSKRGDRILIWCIAASILINIGFCLWLNYADIYGEKRQSDTNRQMHVQVYKPPIKRKPKPKPKIIPPKPKIIPKIVHVLPRPTPPHPAPPHAAPPTHFTVGHHSTSKTAIAVEAPPPPEVEAPAQPVAPENTTVNAAPPAPPAPVAAPKPTPPAPPAPVYHAPPAPKPSPPPPPKHPPGYVATESQQAGISSVPTVNTDGLGIDLTSITGPCVISYKVETTGRITGVRVKKSSGNADFDQAVLNAVRQAHGIPGIQDHILYEESGEYEVSAT